MESIAVASDPLSNYFFLCPHESLHVGLIISRMNIDGSQICVVYGSQTGTAQDSATWLAWKLGSKVGEIECIDGNTFASVTRVFDPDRVYIYIVSTAGNGDFPSNFTGLWSRLFGLNDRLQGVKFAVFGLGDSKYTQFNYAARLLFGTLEHLGGTPILVLGCGDDQHTLGYSQEFVPWVKALWSKLFNEEFPTALAISDSCYKVESVAGAYASAHSPQCFARVVANERVSSVTHFQEIRNLKFETLEKWLYEPGDVLAVRPTVSKSVAQNFIAHVLGDDPCRLVSISSDVKSAVSGTFSLLDLFTKELDITAVPSHYLYEVLHACFEESVDELVALSEEQEIVRDKLRLLAAFSSEGANERLRYSTRERIGIHEVLFDFKRHVTLPLHRLLPCVPRIAPRYYSLCNVANHSPKSLRNLPHIKVPTTVAEICVAILDYTTLYGRHRVGLTSGYLRSLCGPTDRVWFQRGFSLKLKKSLSKSRNMLLVGPGTGMAPLRPLIFKSGNNCDILLLTSFRNPKSDFIFPQDIVRGFGSDRIRTIVAWSRPDDMSREYSNFCFDTFPVREGMQCTGSTRGRKTWVQDLVPIHAETISEFMQKPDVVIVIAGRSHPMPSQFLRALEEVIGVATVERLARSGRIIYDTWG